MLCSRLYPNCHLVPHVGHKFRILAPTKSERSNIKLKLHSTGSVVFVWVPLTQTGPSKSVVVPEISYRNTNALAIDDQMADHTPAYRCKNVVATKSV